MNTIRLSPRIVRCTADSVHLTQALGCVPFSEDGGEEEEEEEEEEEPPHCLIPVPVAVLSAVVLLRISRSLPAL